MNKTEISTGNNFLTLINIFTVDPANQQWRSLTDYQNMRNNPTASPYLEQALQMATFESGMYEVVRTFIPFQ